MKEQLQQQVKKKVESAQTYDADLEDAINKQGRTTLNFTLTRSPE